VFTLYSKASGYSCITQLNDGRLAVAFEAGDTEGFPRVPPRVRDPGYMRLDIMVLPKEISITDRWFSN
jgi:sialidase-1